MESGNNNWRRRRMQVRREGVEEVSGGGLVGDRYIGGRKADLGIRDKHINLRRKYGMENRSISVT